MGAAMDPAQPLINRIAFLLRHAYKIEVWPRKRVVYETIPLLNDISFEDHKLRDVMAPHVPGNGAQTEDAFDSWLWPMKNPGDGDSVQDLLSKSSQDVVDFVTQVSDVGEQTVRLLYCLGNSGDARLEVTPTSIMVHHDDVAYGIIDGIVYSRFCDGMKIVADHMKILTETTFIESKTPEFCKLYREARRQGKNVDKALIALAMGRPKFNFRRISHAKIFTPPTDLRIKALSLIISQEEDPLAKLYPALVPKYMTKACFNSKFGNITTRIANPNEWQRQKYINLMYDYFHKLRMKNHGKKAEQDS